MGSTAARVDAFTDAAFAFAVSLLVIGGGKAPESFDDLARALYDIPAFAFGFAVISVFWLGHLRWRRLCPHARGSALILTLLLVFVVLIYVQPLRSMAAVTSRALVGQGAGFAGHLPALFAVYGSGFAAMSAIMAALFQLAASESDTALASRAAGERGIWLILSLTGAASVATSVTPYGVWAAMVYLTLPITIGIFAKLHAWSSHPS